MKEVVGIEVVDESKPKITSMYIPQAVLDEIITEKIIDEEPPYKVVVRLLKEHKKNHKKK